MITPSHRTSSSLLAASLAASLLACGTDSAPPEDQMLVWPVERGDVVERANQLATRLGLPATSPNGNLLESRDAAGDLTVDYTTGRSTFYAATPMPRVAAPLTDDRLIDAAAAYLHGLELLPAGNDVCLAAVSPAGRSAWKTCATLAVRVHGIDSDLLPTDPTLVDLLPRAAGPDGDPALDDLADEPIEIVFTPRLPVLRQADGTLIHGELAGGHADLIVRFDRSGAIEAFDDRFQPPGATPIEVDVRSLDDALAELADEDQPPGDPAEWTLGFYSRQLAASSEHSNRPHPLRFYYPMYVRLLEGTNLPTRLATATHFLPRVVAVNLPAELDAAVDPPIALWFDATYGSSPPVVRWYLREPGAERRLVATVTGAADPAHPSTYRVELPRPPPDGRQFLGAEVSDDAGVHYQLEDIEIAVTRSHTDRVDPLWTSHGVGAWSDCGPLSICHSDDIKVTAVCLDGECKTGPTGVKVEIAGRRPNIARWNTVFIRDLAVLQFHLDLKLRIPEKRRNLANGWAEDWPATGDPDAGSENGARYKDFWIRTDTCRLDGANTYSCRIVPSGPSPTNQHRKMGMRCPADFGHRVEQGDTEANPGGAAECTAPARVPGGFHSRRVFTGLPGRLTLDMQYEVTEESTGPAIAPAVFGMANGTIIRLVRSNDITQFDPLTTTRAVTLLSRVGALAPAIRPKIDWKWEGDQPRGAPPDNKRYGGMNVECYNVVEFCRQANGYDPRPLPWNHNGARIRAAYPESSSASMLRPWERGQQASSAMPLNDRNEGDPFPYCPHELYKVLKERFCPCPDDGSPCQATGGDAEQRPNPPLRVLEVRLALYERMTPFESGAAGTTLVSEMKTLPEMMMGLEGHAGAKMHSAIPRAVLFNNVGNQIKSYARWFGFLFPALALGAYGAVLVAQVGFDVMTDWIDVFHWYSIQQTMPIVRPLSRVRALAPVNGFINAHYFSALGNFPQWAWTGPVTPPGVFGWGDKTTFPREIAPTGQTLVPAAFAHQGFWQNLHFKSVPANGASSAYFNIVVPGCQSLFPVQRVMNAQGGWFWGWDRSLCVHHHESWFNMNPKQQNHDIAWMIGSQDGGPNPDRVGAVANTQLWTGTVANRSIRRLHFWEMTVGRNNSNVTQTTLNTEFFFTQGPDTW